MSRPTREMSERMERLEGASALVSSGLNTTGRLVIRMQQLARRIEPEHWRRIEAVGDELANLVDTLDSAHELLRAQLHTEQQSRGGD